MLSFENIQFNRDWEYLILVRNRYQIKAIKEMLEVRGEPYFLFDNNSLDIDEMVKDKGINLFFRSIENRKLCCHLRKIEPSKRALQGFDVWISGIRKDQSVSRFYNKVVEWDEINGLIKVNPLLNWTEKQVWDYIKENNVPFNELHNKGFSSIGCQPCTRAIQSGEDFRAGRWWWEEPDQKECGLHNGKK